MANRPVVVKILGDASGLDQTLDQSESRLGRFGGSVARGAAVVGTLGVAAVGAGAIVGAKFYDMGVSAEAMRRKVSVVFEDQTAAVQKWADANNEAFGVTDEKLAGMAASMADLLKPMGFTASQAADMSQEMLNLSGALSAWTGGSRSAAEVSDILSSAMLGERDALKSLGISISAAEVEARLLAKGQQDLTGAALAQAEAIATQELILEKSTDAQKAWADGSMDAVKNQNTLKATLGELTETLSNALFPVIQRGAEWMNSTLVPAVQNVMRVFDERGLSGVVELAKTKFGELWPGVQAGLVDFGGKFVAWIGEQTPKVVEQLARWGAAFVDWIGPKIPPMLRQLGVLLENITVWMFETGLPRLASKLSEWGAALVAWVAPRIEPLLLEFGKLLIDLGEWFQEEALPAAGEWGFEMGKKLAKELVQGAISGMGDPLTGLGLIGKKIRDWRNGDGEGTIGGGGSFGVSTGGASFTGPGNVRVTGRTAPGGTWQRIVEMAGSTGVPGVRATSLIRPGAITRSGNPSYHGMNRAVDFTAPNLAALHMAMQRFGPTLKELIGPLPSLNWRNGRPHRYNAAVQGDHYDHVHAAYDAGGWLPPGVHTVANFTGKPEPILTHEQWQQIRRPGVHVENVYVNNGRSFGEEMALAAAIYGSAL